jgi:hypothetical protein
MARPIVESNGHSFAITETHPMLALLMLASLAAADDPITEITLERTPCYGSCPIDTMVFRADGTAEYTGTRFVKRTGRYTGKIARGDFDALARLVAEKKFFELKDRYSAPITDQPTLITTMKRGDKSKRVSNYGEAGPKELRELEKAIVAAMEKIAWEKAPGTPDKGPG